MKKITVISLFMFGMITFVEMSARPKKPVAVPFGISQEKSQVSWSGLKKNLWVVNRYGNSVTVQNEAAYQQFLNGHDEQGQTIFHHAMLQEKYQVATLLLACGACVNVQNSQNGQTSLYQIARTGNCESVKFLLEHGADKNIKSFDGGTPSGVAMEYSGVYSLLNPVTFSCSIS